MVEALQGFGGLQIAGVVEGEQDTPTATTICTSSATERARTIAGRANAWVTKTKTSAWRVAALGCVLYTASRTPWRGAHDVVECVGVGYAGGGVRFGWIGDLQQPRTRIFSPSSGAPCDGATFSVVVDPGLGAASALLRNVRRCRRSARVAATPRARISRGRFNNSGRSCFVARREFRAARRRGDSGGARMFRADLPVLKSAAAVQHHTPPFWRFMDSLMFSGACFTGSGAFHAAGGRRRAGSPRHANAHDALPDALMLERV